MPGLTTKQSNMFQQHQFIKSLVEKIKDPSKLTNEDLLDILKYADEIKSQQISEEKSRAYWEERRLMAERSAERRADPNWDMQKGYINKEKGDEQK